MAAIVFGPTGNVARIAATMAQQNGSRVFLAMRDPQKPIPGLSPEEESKGGFERLQADLTKPDSVREAVSKASAKRAFIYLAIGSSDHMRATLEALKAGGVEFVVFLSSYTIQEPLEQIQPGELIPYMHAQVEMQLLEVFGHDHFVALRPGAFATNILSWYGEGIKAGHVNLQSPGAQFDCITPTDMGEVAGIILAKGPQHGDHAVYLSGPRMLSQEEQIKIVERALGKEIKIGVINKEQGMAQYLQQGMPEVFARYLSNEMEKKGGASDQPEWPQYGEGVKNVERYTGRKATAFEDWVVRELHQFQ